MKRNTLEEYKKYKPLAINIFNWLNGKVNTINNSAILEAIMYKDNTTGLLANLRYPMCVTIYLGGILESLDEVPEYSYYNSVCSLITLATVHELLHADQALSIIEYSRNPTYCIMIEDAIERESYVWVMNNISIIRDNLEFDVDMSFMPGQIVKRYYETTSSYTRINAEIYYKQTMSNILLRSSALPLEIEQVLNKSENIEVVFNSNTHIIVKMHGIYVMENIPTFSHLSYTFSGMYDQYSVSFSTGEEFYRDAMWTILGFTFSDGLSNPVRFKK